MYSGLYITIHYAHVCTEHCILYINYLMYRLMYSYTAIQRYTSKMMYHHPSANLVHFTTAAAELGRTASWTREDQLDKLLLLTPYSLQESTKPYLCVLLTCSSPLPQALSVNDVRNLKGETCEILRPRVKSGQTPKFLRKFREI